MMQSFSLNGAWQLRYGPQLSREAEWPLEAERAAWPTIPATVPGNVELDMMAAGVIENPEKGNAVYALRAYETHEWWYRRTFAAPDAPAGHRAELVFEGLDCFGTIWVNGRRVGESDNMLIAHRFDVTDALNKSGDNELVVRIRSAVLEGRDHEVEPVESAHLFGAESLTVRKAPHMYGWDIAPRVVSAGLWREARIDVVAPTRWRSVYFSTSRVDVAARSASVNLEWNFATERHDIDGMAVRVRLERGGRVAYESDQRVHATHGRLRGIRLDDVDLWWPKGAGEAALHDLTLELLDDDGAVLDTWRESVGIRTVELERTDITTPESPGEFVFRVNGVSIFMKGTNWVPLDALHSRDPLHLDGAIAMLANLNCNMIRCWGGNVYEDHRFYDLCDCEGMLVWQDFSFACLIYPQTDAFGEVVRREAESVVRKLRNHASIGLWAGNNEIDQAYHWEGLTIDPNTDRLSRHVLPEVVRRFDPYRTYLPSSPYISPAAYATGRAGEVMPEMHLWGSRPYFKNAFYTGSTSHFVSEIGYHGCPVRETLEECMDPEFLWPWKDNDQWATKAVRSMRHQPQHASRIQLMTNQLSYLFTDVPDNLDDYVLASQVAQAEAFKFFIEWFRQAKWRRTGILWWNLRDCWPIISDAIVDYYGRKKLAYPFVLRSQADVTIVCGEPEGGAHPVWVVNDTLSDAEGRLAIRDVDSGETVLECDFAAPANERVRTGEISRPAGQGMWLIEWRCGGETLRSHYLYGEPTFALGDYKRWLSAAMAEDPRIREHWKGIV